MTPSELKRCAMSTVSNAANGDSSTISRNVEPTSKADHRQAAGWFLEEAGGKNLSVGGAQIFDKHANIIVKGPNCKAQDVHDLSNKMITIVDKRFNFKLMREVRFVGKFNTNGQCNEQGFW